MSDIESDYSHYEDARDAEDGLHGGRSDPSTGLVITIAIVIAILILGCIAIAVFASG